MPPYIFTKICIMYRSFRVTIIISLDIYGRYYDYHFWPMLKFFLCLITRIAKFLKHQSSANGNESNGAGDLIIIRWNHFQLLNVKNRVCRCDRTRIYCKIALNGNSMLKVINILKFVLFFNIIYF